MPVFQCMTIDLFKNGRVTNNFLKKAFKFFPGCPEVPILGDLPTILSCIITHVDLSPTSVKLIITTAYLITKYYWLDATISDENVRYLLIKWANYALQMTGATCSQGEDTIPGQHNA